MIQYRPKLKNRKLIAISFLLLVLSVLIFPFASFSGRYASVVQILAIISVSASVFILIKYVIPDYLYTIENGHLTIHKVTKSQSVCVADIELSDAQSGVLTADEYKAQNKPKKVYTYLKNPWSEDVRYISFSTGGQEYTIQLEADKRFEVELDNALKSIKNDEEE